MVIKSSVRMSSGFWPTPEFEGSEDVPVASGETAKLTPQRFVEQIKLILESNPAPLDGEISAELVRVFGERAKPQSGLESTQLSQ